MWTICLLLFSCHFLLGRGGAESSNYTDMETDKLTWKQLIKLYTVSMLTLKMETIKVNVL